jgi:hypothetical protein
MFAWLVELMVAPFYTSMHSNSKLKSFKHMHIGIGNRKGNRK